MKKREIISIVALLVIAAIVGGVAGYKLKQNKIAKTDDEKNTAVETELETIVRVEEDTDDEDEDDVEEAENNSEEAAPEENTEETTEVETRKATAEEKYTYLCIGNSVSCNEYPLSVDGLWWSASGMCVSKPNKDYPHLFKKYLDKLTPELKGDVKLQTIVTKNWENASDRNSNADIILSAITDDTKVVTIQMGENVTENKETMFADFDYLFTGIREKLPNAQVYVFQQLLWAYHDTNVGQAMYESCVKNNFIIVDVADFYEGYESGKYRAEVGAEVLCDDDVVRTVTDSVVAAHPNDAGHKSIFKCLKATYEDNN